MNLQPFNIPSAPALFEEEIKKSVFITHLAHTPSIELAKEFVDQIKLRHSGARHNCWGFVAGRPENSMKFGFSDDGEPSGTAGKPILAQLAGSGVGEITAVVTRYSGGIKLGTGGLVKAYGGGVQQALKLLQTIEKKITTNLKLELDYSLMPLVQSVMAEFKAEQVEADYQSRITLVVEIEVNQVSPFTQTIINKSAAKVLVTPLDDY